MRRREGCSRFELSRRTGVEGGGLEAEVVWRGARDSTLAGRLVRQVGRCRAVFGLPQTKGVFPGCPGVRLALGTRYSLQGRQAHRVSMRSRIQLLSVDAAVSSSTLQALRNRCCHARPAQSH